LLGLLQHDERDRAPDGRDPQRDGVVYERGGGGDGPAQAVEDEHADHAAVEHADPTRRRNEILRLPRILAGRSARRRPRRIADAVVFLGNQDARSTTHELQVTPLAENWTP